MTIAIGLIGLLAAVWLLAYCVKRLVDALREDEKL